MTPDRSVNATSQSSFSAADAVLGWFEDIAPYGIFTTDSSFRIQSWNQWLAVRSGHTAQQLVGKTLTAEFPELITRGIDRRYENALKGEISVLSAALHRYLLPFPTSIPNAPSPHMLQTARIAPLVVGGEIVGTITIVEDVTERETQASILQRQQQHDHMLSRALSVLLHTSDPMRDIEELFPSFTPALGVDAFFTHLSGPDDNILRLSASAGIPPRIKDELSVLPAGEGPCGTCCRTRDVHMVGNLGDNTDPAYRELRASGMRLFACFPVAVGDHLHGVLSVGSYHQEFLPADETKFLQTLAQYLGIAMERIRREALLVAARKTLQEHAESLETKVQERTVMLHEMIAQLESFSYTVAHDLRAPIRALQGYSDILSEDYGHLLPEQGKFTISRLSKAGKRLDALTRDLLRFSKIARADVELEPVDVAEIVEELKPYSPRLQTALSLETPLGVVRGQRTLLQQCVANLLENAVKFAKPHLDLRIRVRSERIDAPSASGSAATDAFNPAIFGPPKKPGQTAYTGPWIRIWIEDNGIGIPERARAKIFGIFERSAGSEHIEGTGIGLAIVARAMHQMGGFCGVESQIGEGSRFWLELPAA